MSASAAAGRVAKENQTTRILSRDKETRHTGFTGESRRIDGASPVFSSQKNVDDFQKIIRAAPAEGPEPPGIFSPISAGFGQETVMR
jgi:hypothetical protein